MKRNFKFLFAALAMIVAAVSCSEKADPENPGEKEPVTPEIVFDGEYVGTLGVMGDAYNLSVVVEEQAASGADITFTLRIPSINVKAMGNAMLATPVFVIKNVKAVADGEDKWNLTGPAFTATDENGTNWVNTDGLTGTLAKEGEVYKIKVNCEVTPGAMPAKIPLALDAAKGAHVTVE